MQSPPVTVAELLEENRRLREQHAIELRRRNETLLDEFAKAALPAIVGRGNNAAGAAKSAYDIADAMIAERDRRMAGGK